MEPPPERTGSAIINEAADYADLAAQAAAAMRRDDLAARIAAAKARLQAPEAAIAVVGEFKQGKSSLINGLLGVDICPVDDDIATSTLTVLRHGDEACAVAWYPSGTERTSKRYPVSGLASLVTEQPPTDAGRVDLVEVFLPNALLARGISIIDTPGANGVRPGYSEITLGYLQACHAAIFVTDASAPLSHEELAFLREAANVSPAICVVLAKIDLFAQWRAIHSIDAAQLQQAGVAVPIFPVSSTLRHNALDCRDAELNDESGFPGLLRFLGDEVVARASTIAVLGVFDAAILSLSEMRQVTTTSLEARESPASAQERLRVFQAAKSRLERLRQGNARWATVLNDGLAELVSQVDHHFRRSMRDLQRKVDEEIAQSDPRATWQELSTRVRDQAAAGAREVIRDMESGADEIACRITELLAEEDLLLASAIGTRKELDLSAFWSPRPLSKSSVTSGLGMGLSGLRGAQGGLMLFGMLTGLAGLAVSTGVLLGVGAVFGGKQLLEERKRQVATRRQEAKTAIKQFLDDTEFEVSRTLRELSRELSRRLRDHYSERISERLRTCSDTVAGLERSLQEDEATRVATANDLRTQARQLEAMIERLSIRRAELAGLEVPA